MCKSKIHRARTKKSDLNYEGSIGIDKDLMRAADIIPYEKVHVLNVTNGARFETYAIEEKAGSGMVALYGAAAHLGKVDDILIILSYGLVEDRKAGKMEPSFILVDAENKIIRKRKHA